MAYKCCQNKLDKILRTMDKKLKDYLPKVNISKNRMEIKEYFINNEKDPTRRD
jgi:hypothetical protein